MSRHAQPPTPSPLASPARFAALLQDFFLQRLQAQRAASPRTVESYRDAFRMLLSFLQAERRRAPAEVALADVDAPHVLAFLEWLENQRGNTAQTRNARLAAVRSFMRYVAVREPAAVALTQRVLAVPFKRWDRPALGFLTRGEVKALLEAAAVPGREGGWCSRRDRALFETLYNTGARVSEATGLRVDDLRLLDGQPCVHLRGKGRKERVVPLWARTASRLRGWVRSGGLAPTGPLFPAADGAPLSRSAVERRLHLAVKRAGAQCPSLARKHVSPHTLRHTTAMHLLQAGVDVAVIALWLGHESIATTHRYLDADMAMMQRTLARLRPSEAGRARSSRYRPSPQLLEFLNGL